MYNLVMSIAEVADHLGVHENTVRNWIRSGELPAEYNAMSRRYTITAEDVRLFREKRERERGQ